MLPEALFVGSKHSHVWEELHEAPGGDQIDGSPPAPVYLVASKTRRAKGKHTRKLPLRAS
eukprot:9425492-Pyramimonas_sp.AAC.1